MNSATLQQHFEEVCKFKKITRSQAELSLFILAKAIWQNNFNPDLSQLEEDSARRRAAYMIDFFSRFHHLQATQKKQLRKSLEALRQQLSSPAPISRMAFYPGDTPGRDQIAHLWGLINGMRPAKIPGLLDLQRRANITSSEDICKLSN